MSEPEYEDRSLLAAAQRYHDAVVDLGREIVRVTRLERLMDRLLRLVSKLS